MGQRTAKQLENYINEAIDNIRDDRARTTTLLSDVMSELQAPTSTYESHKDLGLIAAKYLETLQRSNEQLVKLTSMLQKNVATGSDSLSEEDKNELFDILQGTG